MKPYADMVASQARSRFVRWDPSLWQSVVEGPARQLAERLHHLSPDAPTNEDSVRAYLDLCAKAIGHGYLFPASSGVETLFTLLFLKRIPESLADVPHASRGTVLAQCWNLAENIEKDTRWLHRIVLEKCRNLHDLSALPSMLASVQRSVFDEPRVTEERRVSWIYLGREDPRFLPGEITFLTPSVLCIYDRSRTRADGGRLSMGLWLDPATPMPLGPLPDAPPPLPPSGPPSYGDLHPYAKADPRMSQPYFVASSPSCCAATLVTSQFVVALLPG